MMKKITYFLFISLVLLFIPFYHVKGATQVYSENIYAELNYLTYKTGSTEIGLNYNNTITTGSSATEYYFNTYANLDITNLETGSLVPNNSYVRLSFCSTGGMSNGYGGDSNTTDVRFNSYNSVSCITYNGSQGYLIQATFKVATRTIPNNANRLDISSSIGTFVNANTSFSLIGVDFAPLPFTRINENDSINNNLTNIYDLLSSIQKQNEVCSQIDKSSIYQDNVFLDSYGVVRDTDFSSAASNYGITNFINIVSASIEKINTIGSTPSMCFYNTNKELISCMSNDSVVIGQVNIPNGSTYVRFSIQKVVNKPQYNICQSGNQAIVNSQEQQNQIQQERNDFMNDDNVDESSSTASSFFSGFTSNDHGLTGIITAPLTLIESLTSKTCAPLVVPLPFVNSNLTLPCMSTIYSQYFGSFYTMYQVITFGIVSYWVLVRIFAMVKDFKNPEHDEVEVMDL